MKGKIEDLKVRIRVLDEANTILSDLKRRTDSYESDLKAYQTSAEEQRRTIESAADDSEEYKAAKRQLYWDENGIEETTDRISAMRALMELIYQAL